MAACDPIIDGKPASQAAIDALDWKNSVRAATTAVLPANTFASNQLTGNANGALSAQDGVTLVVNEDILVKNEVAGANNGIYVLIQVGTAGTPYILQRRADANTSAEVTSGMTVPVEEGTVNDNSAWTLVTAQPITLNTTALVFLDILSGAASLAAVLLVGNDTLGTDMQFTAGDDLLLADTSQILAAGAVSGQASALGDDIVIGATGVATDRGLSIMCASSRDGFIFFGDAGSATAGGLTYDHGGNLFRIRAGDSDRVFVSSSALASNVDGVMDLGLTGNRWDDLFAATGFLADADVGDAPAGALNLTIGDGSLGLSFGLTVFTGTDGVGMINMTDVGGAVRGTWSYEHANVQHVWAVEGADEMFLTAVALSPAVDAGNSLGTDALRWLEGFIDQLLVGGAISTDGPAGATDVVIGDGTAAAGITIFTTDATEGTIVFTDGTGVEQASFVYDHNVPQFEWVVETSLEMLLTTVALSPGADAGSSLGTDPLRWLEGFIDQVLVAGGLAADGAATADDLVIGDASGDLGLTINMGAGNAGRIAWNNGTNDEDGEIRYDGAGASEVFTFRVRNADTLTINNVSFFPLVAFSLGASGSRFLEVFAGSQIYGVEPTGATVTVTTNGRIIADATAGNVDVDLPDAATGLDYQLIVLDATNGVDLTPTASDTINGGVAGTALALSVAGRYFITALDATDWAVHGPLAEAT